MPAPVATLAAATLPALPTPLRPLVAGHPRLFFDAAELATLRRQRDTGGHVRLWANLARSADWCLTRPLRRAWLAPVTPDPIYANLYDRFYAMMHDLAVAEHLAFAAAYSGDARYAAAARAWTLALARVWRREADGPPDASKAYAVTRIIKALAVTYDLLADALQPADATELRDTLAALTAHYVGFFAARPELRGPAHETHHASVEAASLGLAALALLGEHPPAADWLALITRWHTDWLLPHALTPSLTHNQTSNFWISITQYRLCFLDALRRGTGVDLFAPFAAQLDGRAALAAAVWPGEPAPPPRGLFAETNHSWLLGPSYGQLDYAAPALVGLARFLRRPIYQHLAAWDASLGGLQRSRFVSPAGEELLFAWGGNAFAWYDPAVPAAVEPGLSLSWAFVDRHTQEERERFSRVDTNELYARASFAPGALAIGLRRGTLVVHAGGAAVLCDFERTVWPPPQHATDLALTDDGRVAMLACRGTAGAPFAALTLTLERPGRLRVERHGDAPWRCWCHRLPVVEAGALLWPNGVRLVVTRGALGALEPDGLREELVVGMGKLPLADPCPTTYPAYTLVPQGGELDFEIQQ